MRVNDQGEAIISVPVADMPRFLGEASAEVERKFPGVTASGFGHLGDGNIHYHVLAPEGAVRGAWEDSEGKQISHLVHDLVTEWNGSISVKERARATP